MTEPRKRRPRYPFVLRDIDIEEVSRRYSFTYSYDVGNANRAIPRDNVTKLDEIIGVPEHEFSYLDETKNKRKALVAMVDITSCTHLKKKKKAGIRCFWCRYPFEAPPLGCPIRYVPSYIVKQYFSYITKDYYTIKEEIVAPLPSSSPKVKPTSTESGCESNVPIVKTVHNDYYEVDGVFCSFNCCMAWVKDNPHNSLYGNSVYLLHDMYTRCFGVTHQIHPAPHWRMLTDYGGHMSIQEFRSHFNKRIYDNMHTIRSIPATKPVGTVFEEFIKI